MARFRRGSGGLLQTLLKHDLVDTLRIWLHEHAGDLRYGEAEVGQEMVILG